MAFVAKPNQCGLFTNTKDPSKSDLNGSIEVACPRCHATSPFWVNAWHKVAKTGTKYISIALKAKTRTAVDSEIPL